MNGIGANRVATYVRWSTDEQTDGTTLEVQLEGCKHYILSQGWNFNPDLLFVDDGYSGGTLDRPQMTKLREAVHRREVDCVVVMKLDRLSRSVLDTVQLVLKEWEGICHVKSAREPVDTTTAMGKQFFYMLVSYAEWERAVIKERTFSGKVRRAHEGRNPGMPLPYGFRNGGTVGSIEVYEPEAEVVREIFEAYARGIGAYQITTELNRRGVPNPRRGAWRNSTVTYILKNKAYIGTLVYGVLRNNPRYRKGEGEPTRFKSEPLTVKEDALPTIVSSELWTQCQNIRAERGGIVRNKGGRTISSKHLLTGIIQCKCGHAFCGQLGNKGRKWYYVCDGYRNHGGELCDCGYIPQDDLHAVVFDEVVTRLRDPIFKEGLKRKLTASTVTEYERVSRHHEELNNTLKGLDEQDKRNRRDYRAGDLSAATYEQIHADIADERRQLEGTRTGLQSELKRLSDAISSTRDTDKQLERFDAWETLLVPERKQLLRTWIESFVVYRKAKSGEPMSVQLRIKGIEEPPPS